MEIDTKSVLKNVFMRVIEDYAFMFGDALGEEPSEETPGPWLQVRMEFQGPFWGGLVLSAPEPFCRQVAANALGLDMDDAEVEGGAEDALKELLNVTCGNVLTTLAGDEPVFDLTVPAVASLSEEEWRAAVTSPDAVGFLVEEWPVFLGLTVRD